MSAAAPKSQAERKREQRERDEALAEAGLIRLLIIVPLELGDYLRGCRFLPMTSEDDPATLASATEGLIDWLIEHKDDLLLSRDNAPFRDLP